MSEKEGFCRTPLFFDKIKSESEKSPGQEDLCRALSLIEKRKSEIEKKTRTGRLVQRPVINRENEK